MRKELAALIQKWADNPDSYFEIENPKWKRTTFIPNANSKLSIWRLVIPPKIIELEYGDYFFDSLGALGKNNDSTIPAKFGNIRQTKELAKQSAKRVLRSNRLSALVDQIAGEPYKFIPGICNTNIYNDSAKGKYSRETNSYSYSPERIYGTPETMKKVCQILNDGLFKLELE